MRTWQISVEEEVFLWMRWRESKEVKVCEEWKGEKEVK